MRVSPRQRALTVAGLLAVAGVFGCSQRPSVDMNNPELATFVDLVLPTRIEIQRHWTQPVSYVEEGSADGLEVILAAYDAVGDRTKIVGRIIFELTVYKMSAGDRMGTQVAVWPVTLDSKESMEMYWDKMARLFRFPLKFDGEKLKPGRYVLAARLTSPTGERLADEYEFTFEAGSARPAKTP